MESCYCRSLTRKSVSATMTSQEDNSAIKISENEERELFLSLVEGLPLPNFRNTTEEWKTRVADLRKMELRHDDILLTSYPKTGTHWIWEVTSMLLQGKAEHEKRRKDQLMMELVDVDVMADIASPRILNTHLPFSMLPWQQIRDKRIKIIHVYRNPKDTAVSFYFMLKDILESHTNTTLEFPDFFERFLNGKVSYGTYFNYLRQFYAFTQENPNVPELSISFEEMKRSPSEKIKVVAEFLKVPASQQLCEQIAEACSFKNMKKRDENKVAPQFNKNVNIPLPQLTMYRKGEVGDWKNYLTVAMSEKMDAVVEKELKGLPYVIQYM